MAKTKLILRVLLGLFLFVFGLNKFLQFMAMPDMPKAASEFMGALMGSGYVMPMVAITEIATGALLVSGMFVPLALVLLAPLSVNIVLFHLVLAPAAIAPAAAVAILNVALLFMHIEAYRPMLKAKPEQGASED